MQLQIKFENAISVSQSSKRDVLNITVLDGLQFRSRKTQMLIEENSTSIMNIPP